MKTKKQLTNRILSLLLALVMVVGLLPMTAYAAADTGAYAPKRTENYGGSEDNDFIFANGTAITIEEAPNGTRIWYMDGATKKYVTNNGENGEDLSGWYIFAGSDNSDGMRGVNGSITMTGGTVRYVMAGQNYGYFGGTSNITITGGTVRESIFCNSRTMVSQNDYVQTVTIYDATGATISTASGKADNVVQKNGTAWNVSGNGVVPSGVTLTVNEGETLTVPADSTLTNDGTIVNNGTIILNGPVLGNGITGGGNVIRNAVYVPNVTTNTGVSVQVNGIEQTKPVELTNNNLYAYVSAGNVKITVNGTDYYGVYSGSGELKLTSSYVSASGFTGIPGSIFANKSVTLNASVGNTTLTQILSYELLDAGNTGAVLNDATLTAYGAGTVKIKVTAEDYYSTYSEEFSISVTHIPVTALDGAVPTEGWVGSNISLPTLTVSPADASYQTIVWSVVNAGSTGATMNGSTLRATSVGTATIRASIEHGIAYGTAYAKDYTVTFNATETIDISMGSVTISQKDDQMLTVQYDPFNGGSKDYALGEPIHITGTTSSNTIAVESGVVANVIIDSLNISSSNGNPFYVKSGASVTLTLKNTNSFTTSDADSAALRVPEGAVLTIDGDGILSATASSAGFGAGIGGQSSTNGESGGTITILDGTVSAKSHSGAGIGGGAGQYKGGVAGDGGNITVSGGTVTATSTCGAGIGGGSSSYGQSGSGGTINITGGTVTASSTSKYGGAGIGSGGTYYGTGNSGGTVTITGGTVKATTAVNNGEAIGKGYNGKSSGTLQDGNGNSVTLYTFILSNASNANVTAQQGLGSYGINDVKTQDTDKLYFYLPAESVATSFTAGGKVYDCTADNQTYYASHDWSNNDGVCARCGEDCGHENQTGSTCGICGIALHTHQWKYTKDGNKITVTCDADGCPAKDGGYVTISAPNRPTYTGGRIEAVVDNKITTGDIVEVNYSADPVNVGTYTASITLDGKEISVTYSITAANISDANVAVGGAFTYDGTAKEPTDITVTLGEKTLTKDTDYTVSYSNNMNAGTATVTVTGKGNYSGTASGSFEIGRANLTDISVQQTGKLVYDGGEALTPTVSTNWIAVNNQPISFTYSTDENGTYGNMPSFEKAGTYTVYFKATAPNHNEATGSFTVTVDKAVVNVPTIASKPFNNSVQTADISDTDLYTVVKNDGGTAKGEYDVVLKLTDSANYKWSTTDSAEVTLKFVISAAENSWTTVPSISGWTYGQNANEPIYAAKYGTVKVVYTGKANDGSDYNSEIAPTKAGNYTATFTVEGTADYSGLSEQVNFTVAKATYDMTGAKWDYTAAFDYDGKEKTVTVIGLPSGVTVSGYEGNKATVVGNYTAKVTFSYDSNNFNVPVLADLNWSIKNDWTPTEYEVNGSGWMNQDFVISAKAGYRISLTNTADGTWSESLTYSAETAEGSVTFYLKDEISGAISLAKTVTYKLDKTAPTGKVEFVERTSWEEFVNSITFGLFYKDEVTVKIDANDNLSGIAKIEYASSNEAKTLNEVMEIADWAEYNGSFGVTLEDAKKFVYFVRITDNAGNVTYLSTDGAEYDTTAPVIEGIENGKTYYTTQKVTVTDKNVDTITLNSETAGNEITLEGNKSASYTVVVTDKAGNSTTVTVTMKPISDLSAPIDTLTQDNVNSGNEQAVDDVKAAVAAVDTTNATDEEKAALKDIADKATELEKVIDDTEAEIARINEELNKINGDTVNSDDAPALEQLAKDIKELLDGDNLTDAERTALTEDVNDVAAMQKTVADTVAENERISDAVDSYDLATVTSEDKDDLEQLLDDINKQLESTNLTEEEISELNGDKKAVEDLLTKIKGTDEPIDKLIGDVDGYSDDTVKSTDKDAIEQIIEDIDDLLETENLTEDEKKALEDAKDKADGLLDTIDEATKATETENTEKVKDVTAENVTPEDKTDLEKAKEDLEKALEDYGDNYTDDENKAIEDEIKRIDDALEVIGNVEAVEELIDKIPENITKNDEDAIKGADDAYNALTDYEKSLVDEGAKKALDDAKAALAELNKPADPDSPQTGDNSNMFFWIALLFISGGAVITLTVVDRKRRTASKR